MKKVTDKRSALLQAALELFAENGFNGASTALIAKRAGVATGTLFLYFKTKEDLIRELFREVRAQINGIAFDNSSDMPIRERFFQALTRLLRYFLANPKEFKVVEQYHFSPLYEGECCTTGENENFRKLLTYAREQKAIKDAPFLVLGAIAFGPIISIAKEHASRGSAVDDAMIEQIVQACWEGLKR